jgi:hypothetical protein
MKLLSVLAIASSVAATLQVRQTSTAATATVTAPTNSTNSTSACSSAAKQFATLIAGIPAPTGSLSTFLATAYVGVTNPCAVTIPTALSSPYLVYGSSVLSFYSVNEAQIVSALAICPSLTSVNNFPICPTLFAAPASATPTVTTSMSMNSTASPTSPPMVVSTAGARDPRESGLMAAALAIAGMVGAVAVAL